MCLQKQRTLTFIFARLSLLFLVVSVITILYTMPSVLNVGVLDSMVSIRRKGSKEELNSLTVFGADMPDPCTIPRRNTGVEDLLCMEPPVFLKQYKNPCWLDNATFRCLPYFYLFGNAKCGTTDFFRRINLHPDILPNKGKSKGILVPVNTFRQFTNYFRGSDIRKSAAMNEFHYKITCLGDPMDFYDRFDEENLPQNTPGAEELLWTTPHVIKHIQPDVKLLLILRDPINRLYSHYFHGRFGTSAKTFHNHTLQSIKVLKDCTANHSVRHCLFSKSISKQLKTPIYASVDVVHLKEWTRVFPLKQIKIFRNEDFSKDIRGTLIKVFQYVNISVPNENILQKMSSMPHYRRPSARKKRDLCLQKQKLY